MLIYFVLPYKTYRAEVREVFYITSLHNACGIIFIIPLLPHWKMKEVDARILVSSFLCLNPVRSSYEHCYLQRVGICLDKLLKIIILTFPTMAINRSPRRIDRKSHILFLLNFFERKVGELSCICLLKYQLFLEDRFVRKCLDTFLVLWKYSHLFLLSNHLYHLAKFQKWSVYHLYL